MMDTTTTTDAFLALSPESFGSFITSPPSTFSFSAVNDFAFAHVLSDTPSNPALSLSFTQASHEYPPLMSPELMQLFGASDIISTIPKMPQCMPANMISMDMISPSVPLSFASEMFGQAPTHQPTFDCNGLITPHLDIKTDASETGPWLSYMQEVLSHPLPFQSSLSSISPRETCSTINSTSSSLQQQTTSQGMHIKQECASSIAINPQSSALQKLHQRLLQRLRKSQQDCPTQPIEEPCAPAEPEVIEPAPLVISEDSKKADNSFNKVLELFSYYFNTQKTASPLACTAALYLGQVGFELQKRYEAYSRYVKCGVLEEMLVSTTRASNLRKLGIKSYEEFLRAEVSELRRIKDPERYLNRRMQVFQSYEPEELEGVYLSFDALYLLAKKPPTFRKEWLGEGKVRIVHICEIHDAWRSSPLNKTKRSRSPTEIEESGESCLPKTKVLKAEN